MPLTLKQFATKGGKARAAKLTKERRIEIAKLAGQASALARRTGINQPLTSKRKSCQSDDNRENKV